MTDDYTQETSDFTDVLRAWLRARREPVPVLVGAMVYELAALIAVDAATIDQAHDLIDWWMVNMKLQIKTLGVGVEHP